MTSLHREAQEKLERVSHEHKMGTIAKNGEFTNALEIPQPLNLKMVRERGVELL